MFEPNRSGLATKEPDQASESTRRAAVKPGIFNQRGSYIPQEPRTTHWTAATARWRSRKMDASRAKARLTRKSRPSDGGRGGKAARPVHPAKGVSARVPRVKARAGRPPIPANDTLPLPADEMTLPGSPELEEAVVAPDAAPDVDEAAEGEASEAVLASGETAEAGDDDDEADEEQEQATTERRRGEDEPASFLAMYFRDMAELDVLRPEQ